MEPSIHVIEAGILRAAFIIMGLIWAVIIVRNRDNGRWAKTFGYGLMLLFFVLGVSALR